MLADRVRPLGFDPATASQVSRPVAICRTNLNSAVRRRRSRTAETSLVSNLVTDLVTGHTWQEALSQWERASDLRRRW